MPSLNTFDYLNRYARYIWCRRCEDYISLEEMWPWPGMAIDWHTADHLEVQQQFQAIKETN